MLVTRDEGAVTALQPDRVLILPDGVEDLWNDEYVELVALACSVPRSVGEVADHARDSAADAILRLGTLVQPCVAQLPA